MPEFNPMTDLLTPEESAQVEQALLTNKDKFSTRVAIYSLRSLKEISQETGTPIEAIPPETIADWVQRDRPMPNELDTDDSFLQFFTQLVRSSLNPLHQIAQEHQLAIADLAPSQIIQWFEQQAKAKLETTN